MSVNLIQAATSNSVGPGTSGSAVLGMVEQRRRNRGYVDRVGVMLVWINGPFGGGKTQTAYELHRRLPDSFVCDPEEVGFGLHRMMPSWLRGDFQSYPSWRQGVFEVLDQVLRRHTDGRVRGRLRQMAVTIRHARK
ncbi:hypothetical protein ACIA8C_21030 [Nocardia sp. NPDC051321]|uniref:hypothetical protein n=1 Tax=Nocardia sp. NPDC051321 TaxID=3364323 RepID=UPI0037A0D220